MPNYADGAPCWADVTTTDPVRTGAFYHDIFGWDLVDQGEQYGHYTLASVGGQTVAALTPPPPGTDFPSVWSVYLKTTDAEAASAAVEKAGGTVVMPVMEIPGQGSMLMAADPTGAMFGVWQVGGHTGAQRYAEDGAICWAEVHTRDGQAADAFYTSAFPLTGEPVTGGPMDYTVYKSGDDMVAGRMVNGDVPPMWLVYFQVPDVDSTISKITSLGGSVASQPEDTPYGRMAVVADPNGAHFAVITPPAR
jgi:predicted enzyme related to lactoylglutathione lyase